MSEDDAARKLRLIDEFLAEDDDSPLAQLHEELDRAERTVEQARRRKVTKAIDQAVPDDVAVRGPLSIFSKSKGTKK